MRYLWKDKKTGKVVEVDRRLVNINIPPDKDELVDTEITIEESAEAEWVRVLSDTAFIGPKGKGIWGRV